jgi:hypothetical protein
MCRAVIGLALVAALTACSAEPQVIHQRIYVKQDVPASLLECAPWPQPDTLPQDVRGLVEWLARAKAAHMDCTYKLEQVRGIVDSQSQ